MRIDKTLSIVIPAFVVLAVLIALLVPWQCAQAQTAGTINMAFDYSAGVDRAMIKQHGTDWINTFAKPQLREAWKNHRSTVLDSYKASAAEIFDESIDPELLLKSESNILQRIADSVATRKARKLQREADSIAATKQTQGALIIEKDGYRSAVSDPELIGLNIGKAYSPRFAFLQDIADSKPAPVPPSGLAIDEDGFVAYVVIVHALAIVGLVAIGIWLLP